jgi:hypothetical protein
MTFGEIVASELEDWYGIMPPAVQGMINTFEERTRSFR